MAAIGAVGFAFGYMLAAPSMSVAWGLSGDPESSNSGSAASRRLTPDGLPQPRLPADLRLPSPQMSPQDVVEAQMDALAHFRTDRSAIYQVYAFASRANRSITGPIIRFERMILAPPYNTMVVNQHWHAGRAATSGNLATVLVTVVSTQNQVNLFRFYLSKQSDGENTACWMTDHVFSLSGGAPLEDNGVPGPDSV